MFQSPKFYGLLSLCLAVGCNVIATTKDYRPQLAILASMTPSEPVPEDQCERCEGLGYYYIRDTGVKKECEVCGGTGKTRIGDASINWIPLTIAQTNGKPTWIHFTTEDCEACIEVQQAFGQANVVGLTQDINCVLLNVPSDQSIIWGVRNAPTDIFVNERWKIIGRLNPPGSGQFYSYLRRNLDDF